MTYYEVRGADGKPRFSSVYYQLVIRFHREYGGTFHTVSR